jgi:argininosuccinate lyase
MLDRDRERFQDARDRMDELPLGSAALAGTSIAIDREFLQKALRFQRMAKNSMDAVSDRDFVLETLAAAAILFSHLSRFSEDLILWASSEFGFITLADAFSTGSSLMPHKKNPDILELTRGRTGQVIGNLVSLLTTLKGLPLAYNRDMQEDKKPLFESIVLASKALSVLSGLVRSIEIDEDRCFQATTDSLLYATDLLDYLILKGIPFQDAHELVGKMVQHSLDIERPLKELSFSELKQFSPVIEKDIYQVFNPSKSLQRKRTVGSTHPGLVAKELRNWKSRTSGFKSLVRL